MVMHARKIARVNDGVYERSQARPYENTEKYPSKGSNYNDRCNIELSRESPMYHRQRDDSPGNRGPRYINKTAYNDNRTKDKFERMPSMSPADKKLNHNSSSGYHGDRSDGDRHNNNDRDHQADKPVLQNNSNEWSEHISSSGKKYYYNSRTEVSQWERPPEYAEKIPVIESRQRDKDFRKQVDKNMSYSNRAVQEDRKHSSGLDSRFDGAKPSFSSASSSAFPRYTDKHSTNQQTYDRWKTVQNRYPSTSNYVDSTAGGSATTSVDSFQKTKMSLPQHTWPGSDVAHRDGFVYGRRDNMPAVSHSYSEISDYRTRRNASYSQGVHGVGNTSVGFSQNGAKPVDSLRSENEDSRLMEDMDISPGSTPTNSPRLARPQSRTVGGMGHTASSSTSVYSYSSASISNATTGSSYLSVSGSTPRSTGVTPTKTLPQLISQLGDKALQRIDSQELTQQAIQTLQQLQHLTSALSRQAQNAAASQSPKSDMTSPFPQQSPQVNSHIVTPSSSSGTNSAPAAMASHHNHHHHHHPHKAGRDQTTPTSTPPTTLYTQQQHQPHPAHVSHKDDSKYDGRDSPNSEVSHRSSGRGSPTPSQSSSQGVPSSAPPGGGITAPAPAPGKPATIQITPSLANCYNEKSIAHVLGWPGIHTERQANRYSEEAHTVGSLHCTQVSADLKKARSLVRVAEIQATLQEQRVLFLQQQIKDLENLKSQNTFMPSPEDKGLPRRPRASESHSDNQHNAT